jgi:hypothetical protein
VQHVHENGVRASFRPVQAARRYCKPDPAKTLRPEDEVDVGLEGSSSKLAGVIVVVEESAFVTHCALTASGLEE